MAEIERKLAEMGLELPPLRSSTVGNFVPAVKTGNLVFLSGHGAGLPGGEMLHVGKIGADLTIEQGYDSARQTMLNLLSSLKGEIGDLDRVKRVVKLGGFVRCPTEFVDQPKVVNGASDLMVEVFGEAGRHARFAVGAISLPLGAAVEVDAVFEIA